MVRRSWSGLPNPSLRVLSAVYGMGADLRNVAWTVGVAATTRAPIPIISVGGLTVGGSGKTPITAALARHLADSSLRVAVLTPGLADEAALHATWNPDVPVFSGRDRCRLARQAAHEGASVVVLDSGFHHRRLERDLDIVTISTDYSGNRFRLPAGPFRERMAEITRADALVVVRRQAPAASTRLLVMELAQAFPGVPIIEARIAPVSLSPVNEAARDVNGPSPNLAVAGVMWPESVLAATKELGLDPEHWLVLPDHAVFDEPAITHIIDLAGSAGLVCTGKDAVKLIAALPLSVPIWQVMERVEWERGGTELLGAVADVAGMGSCRRAVN